jgi:hypothetical protein
MICQENENQTAIYRGSTGPSEWSELYKTSASDGFCLPLVSRYFLGSSEAAGRAFLLTDVIRATTTATAANVGFFVVFPF